MKTENPPLRYICYLSFSKVDNLYSQISNIEYDSIQTTNEFEVEGNAELESPSLLQIIKAKLSFGSRAQRQVIKEGKFNHIQKLSKVMDFASRKGLIEDLSEAINKGMSNSRTVLYYISASFRCKQHQNKPETSKSFSDDYLLADDGLAVKSGVALLEADVESKKLLLSCSLKYFSDMGARRVYAGEGDNKEDYWMIHPHSGNYHFFNGFIPAFFEAIIVLNGQKGNTLYGSPVVLINDFHPCFLPNGLPLML
ncbi:MAG: hypothetical protein IJQ81_17925 [Oscillibacter sp.]|nr:hypothetical protein [Oscillibacter sp.]